MALRDKGAGILLAALVIKIFIVQLIDAFCFLLDISMPEKSVYTVLIQLAAVLLPALYFYRDRDLMGSGIIKAGKLTAQQVINCMVLGCCVQSITIILNLPLSRLYGGTAASGDGGGFLGTVIFIALLPALCEELLFRGVILTSQKGRGAGAAVFASAVYFALMHTDIRSFIGVVFLGMILGMTALSSNSVIAAMLVHIFNNAFGSLLQYLAGRGYNSDMFYSLLALVAMPVLVMCLRRFPLPRTKNNWTAAFTNLPFLLVAAIYIGYEIIAYNYR